jgi:hypothetical protein
MEDYRDYLNAQTAHELGQYWKKTIFKILIKQLDKMFNSQAPKQCGGSKHGQSTNIQRDRDIGNDKQFTNYPSKFTIL